MEDNNKLVKVYSNQSKKARLKRNKNKFQRIWDAEKQTYVKVHKAKYPVRTKNVKKDWREVNNVAAIKRRKETPKKPKSVPVSIRKSETKQEVRKAPARVHTTAKTANILKIHGVNHVWDSKSLCYKRAA